jgi:polyphosphate kinase 2 (PPK2 family)
VRNGTRVVKFFLHLSKEEQRRRFLRRLENPDKHWKFSSADLAERAHWDAYMHAFEEAITETSTEHAPWYVVPADHKHVAQTLVAGILVREIEGLGLSFPTVSDEEREHLARAREQLLSEE